ncbi:MAG: hypothetical protein J6Y89_05240 [Lachnospiraceae bacterium]|nr:hypothetical protein [Lachnospiraceae bacterium]
MKRYKLFAGLLLLVLAILIPNAVSTQAAVSKKVELEPWFHSIHSSVVVYVKTSLKDVVSYEIAEGKIKKTADKYWKKAVYHNADYSYYDSETGITEFPFDVYKNGTYSVRVTTKSGKKYVNYIKISHIEPVSDRGKLVANIKKISKPDSKGNYTITVDYKDELTVSESLFEGTKVGDVVSVGGREVEILDFMTQNADYETTSQKKYDENVECVVVLPKNAGDFYDLEANSYIAENPKNADFGFIRNADTFIAYDDFEYWAFGGDYYVNLYDTVYAGVKLKVTADTLVRLAYANRDLYGDIPTVSGTDYCAAWKGTKKLEDAYVYTDLDLHIYEKYTKKKGFTDTVSEIVEIYTP